MREQSNQISGTIYHPCSFSIRNKNPENNTNAKARRKPKKKENTFGKCNK
jgi:hypothetical protein